MDDFISKINWQCPECGISLINLRVGGQCQKCGRAFKVEGGRVDFLTGADRRAIKDEDNRLRDFFKRWPRFYNFMIYVLGPAFTGLSAKKFIKEFLNKGMILNLGSGPRILSPQVINLDLYRYAGVKIVADILQLPISDNSVEAIVCDTVIEHVKDPRRAIDEMRRVLIKGGSAYITFPFMYPFHASPNDFYRWTKVGFSKMLNGFEVVEFGVRSGVFSALAVHSSYLIALLFSFGNRRFYWLLVNASMLLFLPIKLLDLLFYRLPFSSDAAAIIYCVAKKK